MGSVVLSICYQHGKLGAAYYEEDSATVRILHDVFDDTEFRFVKSLLMQVEPTMVITSKSQEVAFLSFLSDLCTSSNAAKCKNSRKEHDDRKDVTKAQDICNGTLVEPQFESEVKKDKGEVADVPRTVALHLMPSIAYNLESARKRITTLFQCVELNMEENMLKTAFRIDLAANNMVRSLGALLKYLDAVRLGVEFEDYAVKTPIVAIKVFTVEQMLEIDPASFYALQIFREDRHPSAFKAYSASGTREGASLFRICNRCKSNPGRALLRLWFERPIMNREVLEKREAAISFFVQDCNMDAVDFLSARLRHIVSPKGILRRSKGGRLSVNDWKNLYKTCANILQITDYIKMREIKLELVADELNDFKDELTRITAVLTEVIDFDSSTEESRFVVNPNIDSRLDKLKEIYASLPQTLTDVARSEATRLNVTSCAVGYVPMLGYLLTLPVDADVTQSEGLTLVFEAVEEKVKHMKNAKMKELDETIGDVKMEIVDAETTAMLRLQKFVCSRARCLLQAVHTCASLECCISLALTAREYGWKRPSFVDEAIIDVNCSKHPLSDLLSPTKFVANPIRSGGAQTKVKMLTGPNASGKSVYLKQVGLIAFLAHIGSFVPAERAVIGPIDRIMTRMYTVDSVLDGLSTFTKDLTQMAVSLRRGTANSLIIIDEFGNGTMMEVGLALLASALNYWIDKGKQNCPHIFFSSHFHSLVEFLHKDPELVSFHALEVVERDGELEFQYKLVDGLINCSFAAYTAAQRGTPTNVVSRSIDIYSRLKDGLAVEPVNLGDIEEALLLKLKSIKELINWDLTNDCRGFLDIIQNELRIDNSQNKHEGKAVVDSEKDWSKENEDGGAKGNRAEAVSQSKSDSTLYRVLRKITSMNSSKSSGLCENTDARTALDSSLDTSATSILKRKLHDQSSRSSRSVSFMSPLAVVSRNKLDNCAPETNAELAKSDTKIC